MAVRVDPLKTLTTKAVVLSEVSGTVGLMVALIAMGIPAIVSTVALTTLPDAKKFFVPSAMFKAPNCAGLDMDQFSESLGGSVC